MFTNKEQLADTCASTYLVELQGTAPAYHGNILRKVFLKGAEAAIANAWHAWPNERPPHDGKYLVVMSYRHRAITKVCVRSFRDGDWIFSCKTEIDYWMEIPPLPKHVQL